MKTISLTNTGNKPQTVYASEGAPMIPTQQSTISHTAKENVKHPRNIQISNEYIFVKRYGSPAVGMHVDDFIKLCAKVEPKISWPPIFIKNTITQGAIAVIESEFEQNNPELSETDNVIIYQWQQGDNRCAIWNDIKDNETFSGTKTNKLLVVNVAGEFTKTLRCIATNAAGSRASLPITSGRGPGAAPVEKSSPTPVNPPLVEKA